MGSKLLLVNVFVLLSTWIAIDSSNASEIFSFQVVNSAYLTFRARELIDTCELIANGECWENITGRSTVRLTGFPAIEINRACRFLIRVSRSLEALLSVYFPEARDRSIRVRAYLGLLRVSLGQKSRFIEYCPIDRFRATEIATSASKVRRNCAYSLSEALR